MAQYDVYDTPVLTLRQQYPYVVSLQSDLLDLSGERIVAPLVPAEGSILIRGHLIIPIWLEEGQAQREYLLLMPAMTTVRADSLSRPVASAHSGRHAIQSALKLLFFGMET